MVCESVAEDREVPIRRRSQQVELSVSTTWRILRKDLALKACKVQITQELKPFDHLKRRSFINFINEQPADFSQKIMFSYNAHFELGVKQLYCLPNFLDMLSSEMVMLIGHQDHVIYHRLIVFFEVT